MPEEIHRNDTNSNPNIFSQKDFSLLSDSSNTLYLNNDEFQSQPLTFWERVGEQKYWLHLLLFVITFLTTTLAGATWVGRPLDFGSLGAFTESFRHNFKYGLPYSISFLLILTAHEFGHFFASIYHSVKASLPYFIPMPPIPILLDLGTFGAMIRIRERIPNSKVLFDVGVYGPISGFVVAFAILILGFITVPPVEYLFHIHPEYEFYYQTFGAIPEVPNSFVTGKNLLYFILEKIFANPNLPPMQEMYHYPLLFAGWLGCFVTALNMLPVGQLDGGHVIYAMFGLKSHRKIARIFVGVIICLGLPAFIEWMTYIFSLSFDFPFAGFPYPNWVRMISWSSWIIWAIILVRFIKVDHPPVLREHKLDKTRQIIGWLSLVMFVLCFTPVPFGQQP